MPASSTVTSKALPGGCPEPLVRRLVVVPPAARASSPTGFAVAVVLILSGGLVGLLAINTAVAEEAFRVHELRQQSAARAPGTPPRPLPC